MSKLFRMASCALLVSLGTLFAAALPAGAAAPAPDHATANYEVRFLEGMIDHHAMAVRMADTCVDKAVHDQLRDLCEQIIASQSSQIDTMQSWLQDWYGISYEPQATPGEMQQMHRMASMDGAGFEMSFLKTMVRHHRKAVHESSTCVDRAYHGELVDLCRNIIASQSAEIDTMQQWLCDWYGRCEGAEET